MMMMSNREIRVLDHGYVRLVESYGSDERVIESARMSTNKGFNGWDSDQKLLNYLYKHKHMTPFEFCGMTIEVQLPLFVVREWHRHRTQSYNEMSARYTKVPDVFYIPEMANVLDRATASTVNKQAQPAEHSAQATEASISMWLKMLEGSLSVAATTYAEGIARGVPKELARLAMPVAQYTRMRASANLRNWLQFLRLRLAPEAQYEIRQYAIAVDCLIAECFPRTWELFNAEQQVHE